MNALPSHLSPEPTDSEDVVSALETADVFWTKGDADEAMRWLKRAAESASDAGNDDRALAIARTVADLKAAPARAVEAPIATHKLSRPPPPPSAARQAPSPPSAARSVTAESSEVRRAPAHLPSPAMVSEGLVPVKGPTSQKAPPPTPKPRESVSPAAAAHRPSSTPPPAPTPKRPAATERAAVDIQESTRAVAASNAKQQAPSAAAAAPEPVRPAPATPQPSRTQPLTVSSAEAPVVTARRPSSAIGAPKEANCAPATATAATAYRALTVFVRPEGRNGDKLEVILAMPGQAVPAGAEPAMLVPTRRGARLLGE